MGGLRTQRRVLLASALVIAASAAITGCGAGAGPGTRNVSVLVTANFGASRVGEVGQRRIPGSETVMSLLEQHFKVTTSYGGGFVDSINGRAGGSGRTAWFYYVNGIEAPKGAAGTAVNAGDHIWWDLHSWAATQTTPAVVGSYPEPFTNGIGGKEFSILVDCAAGMQQECDAIGSDVHHFGVKAADHTLATRSGSDSLAVVVGTWTQVHNIVAAHLISAGPQQSGVFAQFGGGGHTLRLENPLGDLARMLRGSVGLVAATGNGTLSAPTWFVTGTDAAGVRAAVGAFTKAHLDGHFAVAVDAGRVIPLPVTGSAGR
ncbi:MAG: DUF4430 domain-containing protein [Solirubrobacteraceae bacterium]